MSQKSGISWTASTWNCITGCTRVSPGCQNCYAESLAATRLKESPRYKGLAVMSPSGPRWTGQIRLHEELLNLPLRWRKPRRIFVNSMSDLFHEQVPTGFIERIFAVMAMCPHHIFQILTKRPDVMMGWFDRNYDNREHAVGQAIREISNGRESGLIEWPLPNVWLGVSAENQESAEQRIPTLLRCPAAVRFVSLEPLLGPVDLTNLCINGGERLNSLDKSVTSPSIDWVIVGGESGPHARRFYLDWAECVRKQCDTGRSAFFMKQIGSDPRYDMEGSAMNWIKSRNGSDPSEWPESLRIQEFPKGIDCASS